MTPIGRSVVAALAALAIVAGAGPAAADASVCDGTFFNSPDGRIKLNRGTWAGTDQYPVETLATGKTTVGQQVTFTYRWKNLTLAPKTIRVSLFDEVGLGKYTYGFTVGGVAVPVNEFREKDRVFTNVAPGQMTPAVKLTVTRTGGPRNSFFLVSLQGKYGGANLGVCDQLQARTN